MTSMSAFTTKYYYNCIVMSKKPGNLRKTYSRKAGVKFGISPSLTATAVENQLKREGFLIESITLRLKDETGEVVLQTDMDLDKEYPEGGTYVKKPEGASKSVSKAFIRDDFWDYLTFVNCVTQTKTKFNVKEHMK